MCQRYGEQTVASECKEIVVACNSVAKHISPDVGNPLFKRIQGHLAVSVFLQFLRMFEQYLPVNFS